MQQRGMSGGGGRVQHLCQQQRQQRCCQFQITPIYLVSYFLVYSKISLSNMQQQQCLQQGRRIEVAASELPIHGLYSVIWFILRSS